MKKPVESKQDQEAITVSGHLERHVMPEEALMLSAYHADQADYWLACKQTNMKHSRNPPDNGGKVLTKEDWLDRAKRFDEKRKFHRQRARIFLAMIEA